MLQKLEQRGVRKDDGAREGGTSHVVIPFRPEKRSGNRHDDRKINGKGHLKVWKGWGAESAATIPVANTLFVT
eukprot:gene26786-biopygen5150